MIEPTDEMRMVAYREAREWAAAHGHQQPDDRMLGAVLAAVLAIVERDYVVVARDEADNPYLEGGPQCECPEIADTHTANCPRLAWVLERQRRWAAADLDGEQL